MLRGLKLGLVAPFPPPAGGMANQAQQLAALLRGEGCEVLCVRTNEPYRPRWIAGLPGVRALFRLLPYVLHLWRIAGRAQLFHVMANSGWSWHLFTAPAIWIARMRGVPVVLNYRGGEADAFMRGQRMWVMPSLRRVQCVAVPSGFLRDVFSKYGVNTVVLSNIIDLTRFVTRVYVPRETVQLIVTRNLEAIYDCATAIRAFAQIRQRFPLAHLTIAGRGPERENLIALSGELGIESAVSFPGSLDRAAMAALYASADLMINPSRVDNMPNSVLEALASGVPVVSTNVGGIPYLVEDGRTALLVPAGDEHAMADALLRVLESPDLARSMIEAGLQSVQQYSWTNMRDEFSKLYTSLVPASAPTKEGN